MSTKSSIRLGRTSERVYFDDPEQEVRARFEHIKEELRRREPFEVTNRYVLSVLLDLYWLHAEADRDIPASASNTMTQQSATDGGIDE